MNNKAVIEIITEKPAKLAEAFGAELKNPKNDRSDFEIVEGKKSVKFIINANDPVALRATCDSILKLVIVYDKMSKIK